MEDLRNEEQIAKDEQSWSKKSIHTFTAHIPTIWQIIKIFIRKTFKYFLIAGIIISILAYPNEIGTFIGNWSYEFWTGLTSKF
jgi:hypothetical protein